MILHFSVPAFNTEMYQSIGAKMGVQFLCIHTANSKQLQGCCIVIQTCDIMLGSVYANGELLEFLCPDMPFQTGSLYLFYKTRAKAVFTFVYSSVLSTLLHTSFHMYYRTISQQWRQKVQYEVSRIPD